MIAHVKVDGVNGRRASLLGARGYFDEFAGAARSKQQTGAFGGESERSGSANSGAGPSDEDDLSLEAHEAILAKAVCGIRDVGYVCRAVHLKLAGNGSTALRHAVLADCPVLVCQTGLLRCGKDLGKAVGEAEPDAVAGSRFAKQSQVFGAEVYCCSRVLRWM